MAIVRAYRPTDLLAFGGGNVSRVVDWSTTSFTVSDWLNTVSLTYEGQFTYQTGRPAGQFPGLVGGTINTFVYREFGQISSEIRGLSLDARFAAENAANLDAIMFAGTDFMIGSSGRDRLVGYGGHDRLDGEGGNDTLQGGTGNDWLAGRAGDDSLQGEVGLDTAAYAGLRRSYQISSNPAGTSATVSGPEGRDTLSSIEILDFADGWLAFDATSSIGTVSRLYQAALGRAADPIGLGGWVAGLEAGRATAVQTARAFTASAEFTARFGAPDNGAFVSLMYQNVLGRAPDAAGLAGWRAGLDSGAQGRAEVLLGFAESAEFMARNAGRFQSGVWAPDPIAVEVTRLYATILDRTPDGAGLLGWITTREAGATLQQVAQAFMAGPEFTARYGNLSNQAFVERLYLNALDRPGEPAGVAGWTQPLNTGAVSRADVVMGFAFSAEMTAKLTPAVADGILFV